MSTYYDIKCLDCGEEAGWHWNHGEEQLAEILACKEMIAAAAPMVRSVDVTELRIGHPEWGGGCSSVEFIADHLTHNLAVVSEYGDVYVPPKKETTG